MNIKPIETIYNGHRFRSRLEARWAVFFDTLGVEYEYEPEGFELPSGKKYLPDFRLKCWATRGLPLLDKPFTLYVEVKGEMTEEDAEKIREFTGVKKLDEFYATIRDLPIKEWEQAVRDIKYDITPVLVVGNIPPASRSCYDLCDSERFKSYDKMNDCDIYPFNYETIDYDHFACYPTAINGKFYLMGDDSNYIESAGEELMNKALDAARMARFEHGEKGWSES